MVMRQVLPECMLTNPQCNRVVAIFDCRGVGLHHMHYPALAILQALAKLDAANYPEMLYRAYVVNAPFTFTTIWAVVKLMLDPGVQAKVQILGSKFQVLLCSTFIHNML